MIPDSHAHLDLIEDDVAEVISRADSSGVSPIITVGINVPSSQTAARLAAEYESVYATAGIHPNDSSAARPADFRELESLARENPGVVAIGETGLDYYRDRSPEGAQQESFRAQIKIARELSTTLVVHDRQAHDDTLRILDEESTDEITVVLHCFSGDERMLEICSARGYYISFAGPLTFKNAKDTRAVAMKVPLDRLLVETDSPFLSPDPFRGKPNRPERVRLVAETLARLRSLSIEEMEKVLVANTSRAFRIGEV